MRDSTIFFFQAEDGIRDSSVTGVQTCALPISGCQTQSFAEHAVWTDPQIHGGRMIMAVRIWAEAEALRLAEEIDLLVKKFGLNRGDTAIGLAGGIVYLVAGKGWQDFVRTVRY